MNCHERLRDILDAWAASRIRKAFCFNNSVDIGSGSGGIAKLIGAVQADWPVYDAHNLWQFKDSEFDLVVCSNVLEHLHTPASALREFRRIGKYLWLSWTPWLSPFGGHEFSPWHWFGRQEGHIHQLGVNLHKTYSEDVMSTMESIGWTITSSYPRYWPFLPMLARVPGYAKDVLSWNIEIHAR